MSVQRVSGFFACAALACMICADVAVAQGGGRTRGNAGGMMRMMGGNNQFGLLADRRIQEELELVDEQIEELESIQSEAMKVIRDMFSERQDWANADRENIREKMQEKMKPFEGRIKDVLLPHQHSRLQQLAFQSSGRGSGAGGALNNPRLLDELNVTDEQKKQLEEAIEEAREKLQKQIAKLQKEAEDDILGILDTEQRKKYRELVGDSFNFDNRSGLRPPANGARTDRRRGRDN